jgi:hypothetical protein
MPENLARGVWRKSTLSHTNGCVEVRILDSWVEVRDSTDRHGPVLFFSLAEWQCFLDGVRNDEFDLPKEAVTR